jgi:beta-phosphoglucomutase-like phosphatase (HAD superfamily)
LLGDGLVQTIVTADDVSTPTASGDAYRLALAELGAPAHDSLVFSGSQTGVRTAMSVGLAGVLVDPDIAGARADYDGLRIADCQRLHAQLWARGNRSAAA